jgi:hypothetical protein
MAVTSVRKQLDADSISRAASLGVAEKVRIAMEFSNLIFELRRAVNKRQSYERSKKRAERIFKNPKKG